MSNKHPFLYFNFANEHGVVEPLAFTKPLTIIQANKPDEVIPSLHNVQRAIDDGYYAAGYMGYEAASAFYPDILFRHNENIPLLWFGIFEQPTPFIERTDGSFHVTRWQPSCSVAEYNEAFDRVYTYIKEGETDQVNLTIQMEAHFSGDSFAFFKQLENAQAANYSAYLHIDQFSILSASPELFFHMKDGKITTKPMKGTIGRGKTSEEDIENANWLKNSHKNRYENKLIVQLMKRELAKVAVPNTVAVPKQYEVEQYPTVYQMTSTVTAQMMQHITINELFQALFPCGSITGQPKHRTMELINEYENTARGIYCGAIGFMTPQHEAIFNVPIRTVLIDHILGKATYGVGGAITIDSTKEEEYEEIITKAAVLTEKREAFHLLETIGLQNGEYIVLDYHMKRLKQSATYFSYSFCETELRQKLARIAQEKNEDNWRIRVLLDQHGAVLLETEKVTPQNTPVSVQLAKKPIDRNDHFLYHKTTNRSIYDEHQSTKQDVYDVLLWNEKEQITEFTTGNVVVEHDGELITPPINCGLLPGTYRQSLLDQGKIKERIVTKQDLLQCDNIWFINSVRKWIRVHIVET